MCQCRVRMHVNVYAAVCVVLVCVRICVCVNGLLCCAVSALTNAPHRQMEQQARAVVAVLRCWRIRTHTLECNHNTYTYTLTHELARSQRLRSRLAEAVQLGNKCARTTHFHELLCVFSKKNITISE